MGAYVLARDERVIAYLTNFSGEFIYSTFLPPAQAGAALAAIARVQASGKERQALRSMSKAFRQRLAELGWPADEGDSPIVPVITGDAGRAIEIRDRLLAAGILVGAVRPPTVPRGTARLRISLHSGVTEDDLDEIIRHLLACPRV
jgi:8-amino-7-oxononanoate synthase